MGKAHEKSRSEQVNSSKTKRRLDATKESTTHTNVDSKVWANLKETLSELSEFELHEVLYQSLQAHGLRVPRAVEKKYNQFQEKKVAQADARRRAEDDIGTSLLLASMQSLKNPAHPISNNKDMLEELLKRKKGEKPSEYISRIKQQLWALKEAAQEHDDDGSPEDVETMDENVASNEPETAESIKLSREEVEDATAVGAVCSDTDRSGNSRQSNHLEGTIETTSEHVKISKWQEDELRLRGLERFANRQDKSSRPSSPRPLDSSTSLDVRKRPEGQGDERPARRFPNLTIQTGADILDPPSPLQGSPLAKYIRDRSPSPRVGPESPSSWWERPYGRSGGYWSPHLQSRGSARGSPTGGPANSQSPRADATSSRSQTIPWLQARRRSETERSRSVPPGFKNSGKRLDRAKSLPPPRRSSRQSLRRSIGAHSLVASDRGISNRTRDLGPMLLPSRGPPAPSESSSVMPGNHRSLPVRLTARKTSHGRPFLARGRGIGGGAKPRRATYVSLEPPQMCGNATSHALGGQGGIRAHLEVRKMRPSVSTSEKAATVEEINSCAGVGSGGSTSDLGSIYGNHEGFFSRDSLDVNQATWLGLRRRGGRKGLSGEIHTVVQAEVKEEELDEEEETRLSARSNAQNSSFDGPHTPIALARDALSPRRNRNNRRLRVQGSSCAGTSGMNGIDAAGPTTKQPKALSTLAANVSQERPTGKKSIVDSVEGRLRVATERTDQLGLTPQTGAGSKQLDSKGMQEDDSESDDDDETRSGIRMRHLLAARMSLARRRSTDTARSNKDDASVKDEGVPDAVVDFEDALHTLLIRQKRGMGAVLDSPALWQVVAAIRSVSSNEIDEVSPQSAESSSLTPQRGHPRHLVDDKVNPVQAAGNAVRAPLEKGAIKRPTVLKKGMGNGGAPGMKRTAGLVQASASDSHAVKVAQEIAARQREVIRRSLRLHLDMLTSIILRPTDSTSRVELDVKFC